MNEGHPAEGNEGLFPDFLRSLEEENEKKM